MSGSPHSTPVAERNFPKKENREKKKRKKKEK